MIYLLIDNSNTRTKFVLSSPDGLLDKRCMIPTRELCGERLALALEGWKYDFALICSVVPRVAEVLCDWLPCPFHVLSCESNLGIGIRYPLPKQIGADRLANAVGVVAYYGAPSVVVDFGTAVTFDVVSDDGFYLGGVIAPGLASMGDYLVRNTALLPAVDPREPDCAIGKSTEQAIHAGSIYGYRGLVKEILVRIEEEMPGRPYVVATGGDAELIAKGVSRIDAVDGNITLNGMRLVANLNVQG